MEIKIKATGAVILTDELKALIGKKLQKIEKLLTAQDTTALVEVEVGTTSAGHRTGDVYRAEFNVTFGGNHLARSESVRDTLQSAIDEAIKDVRREIRKAKGKERSLFRRGAADAKTFFRTWGK